MTIETKELVISEELKRKVEMICRFAYVDYEFINGNIKSIVVIPATTASTNNIFPLYLKI